MWEGGIKQHRKIYIYIYNEAVEGRQSRTEEGWKLMEGVIKGQRKSSRREKGQKEVYREGGRRKNTALTSTVTNRSNTFQGFLQKVLKLSIHLSTISTENMITVKLSMKFSNSLNTIRPWLSDMGSSALGKDN